MYILELLLIYTFSGQNLTECVCNSSLTAVCGDEIIAAMSCKCVPSTPEHNMKNARGW